MRRPLLRSSLPAFAAACLFFACSSESNDFFGDTGAGADGGAGVTGKGGAASGGGGSGAGAAGNSSTAGTQASGGSQQSGGSSSGGTGGSSLAGSSSGGTSSAGDSGEGGDGNGPAGMGGTPDEVGGTAGSGGGSGSGASGGTSAAGGTGASGGASGSGGSAAAGSGGTGGSGGTPGTSCEDNDDCDDDEYCSKQACNADRGTCAPRPDECKGTDAVFSPVCGCDWMTYYTPCVAAREGVNVRTSGECSGMNQPTCNRDDGGDSCSPRRRGARCYRPRMNCDGVSAPMGVCWVLPDECPDEAKINTYCGGTSGEAECVGLCEVLDREDAVFRNSRACRD